MPSITDMIDARITRFMRALRLPFRARLSALNGDPALQMVQGKGLAGEALQAVEVLQQFGFSSGIPADSQLIVLPLAGRSSASVVIATEHGAYRLKVGPGEARMYSQEGAYVHIKAGRIVDVECDELRFRVKNNVSIEAGQGIHLDAGGEISQRAPDIVQQGNVSGEGYNGGKAVVQMHADIQNDGTINATETISSDTDVLSAGKSGAHHTHTGVQPGSGNTGQPQ